MIIIGEKINGTRSRVGKAIAVRDTAFIQQLASDQVNAGATYLDVNAGTAPDKEPQDLVWLIQSVQQVVSVPLCLDSANPEALRAGLAAVHRKPIINSLSGEKKRIEGVLPLACGEKTDLIVLALDDGGIPVSADKRLEIVQRLVALTRQGGLEDGSLFIDPLVTALATDIESGNKAFDTMRRIRAAIPQAHITSGLSNISFGLPVRTVVNQAYAVLAVSAGMDSAIMDPLDQSLRNILYAAEVTLGRDRYCMNYTKAYRQGLIKTA